MEKSGLTGQKKYHPHVTSDLPNYGDYFQPKRNISMCKDVDKGNIADKDWYLASLLFKVADHLKTNRDLDVGNFIHYTLE